MTDDGETTIRRLNDIRDAIEAIAVASILIDWAARTTRSRDG
jgi:hypothetical protein